MDVTSIKTLGLGSVVKQEAVIRPAAEAETADGENELRVVAVKIYEVRRATIGGVGVGGTADDAGRIDAVAEGGWGPARVGKVVFVGGENGAAGAGDVGEI